MDKYPLIRKGFAVGIILLFIGVAFLPSINFNVVKASNDNDFVEVTTQACGIKGNGDTTVKLTRQQYQNLEEYLVNFRERLNQTTTREEAVPLFKDAVVELNKYGLLPKGMSIKQAQKLVIGGFQNEQIMKLAEKVYNQNRRAMANDQNFFCLVSGSVDNSLSISVLTLIRGAIAFFSWIILSYFIHINLTYAIIRFTFRMPLDVFGFITFGWEQPFSTPGCSGWVHSVSLAGIKKWNGSILGHYPIEIGTPFGGFILYGSV